MPIGLINNLISIGYGYALNSLSHNHFLFNITLFLVRSVNNKI